MEEIDVNATDDVTLFADAENVSVKKIDFELEQFNKIQGFYNKLTVFNDSHCYQLIKRKLRRKIKFRTDITYLNPDPIRQHKIAWKYFLIALPFLLVSLTMAYAGLFSANFEPSNHFFSLLGSMFLLSVIFILLAVHLSYDKWVFKSEYSNIDLIELLNNQPDKASFKTFIDRLSSQIKKAKEDKNRPLSECLVGELRELRRLKDETAISDEKYESAKKILLKHKGFV